MSLGPVMVDIAGIELSPEEREMLQHPLVGGVILFTRNFQDVDQLGKFIQFVAAEEGACAGNALVATDGDAGAVQMGIGAHGAEFVDAEDAAVQAYTFLAEEYRSRAG